MQNLDKIENFVLEFEKKDLFDADKRNCLRNIVMFLARIYFRELYLKGTCPLSIINIYDFAREKLEEKI